MIKFSKLKLNGFKSFIERGEVDINVGLTGIVGPNGCGKSNLVEALRWCMGESSAKRMRGSGMEDVIFNGTERRPARNFAEVIITLDNQGRAAPPAYNQYDEIEISRRITRDKGSNYRINGKNARARDVQMLFADTMTGANSPALVSQGRVAEIINAKPVDRRQVLEESAGVAGLYARRHEAEIRLRAAETNLTRLDDISESMQSRLESLKRQARQAERYKEFSSEIRILERQIAYAEWYQSKKQNENALRIYDSAESLVAENMKKVTDLSRVENESKRNLPALRDAHIKLTSAMHAQKLSLSRLEDEEQKITSLLDDSKAQLKRSQDDLSYEKGSLSENQTQLAKIEQEEAELHKHLENEEDVLTPLKQKCDQAKDEVKELESKHETQLEQTLSANAQKTALLNEINSLNSRKSQQDNRRDQIILQIEELESQLKDIADIAALNKALKSIHDNLEEIETKQSAAHIAQEKAQEDEQQILADIKQAQQENAGYSAEQKTLKAFLNAVDDETLLDDVIANKGFETALSRALGDTLLASLNPEMNKIWQSNAAQSLNNSWADGIKPLKSHIKAPKELDLALSYIGYIDECVQGEALAAQLSIGQTLVSKSGALWRWDGYHIKAAANDQLASFLEHQNRLREIDKKHQALHKMILNSETALAKTREGLTDLRAKQNELTANKNTHQQRIRALENDIQRFTHQSENLNDKIAQNKSFLTEIETEQGVISQNLNDKQKLLASFDDSKIAAREEELSKTKHDLQNARETLQQATLSLDKQQQEQNRRKARIHAIADERLSLKNRTIRGADQLKKLEKLNTDLQAKIDKNQDRPALIEQEKQKLLSALNDIEAEVLKASDNLSQVEIKASEAAKSLKEAEASLASAREDRAAAHANVANSESQLTALRESIQDQFSLRPSQLIEDAEHALNLDDQGQDISRALQMLRANKDSVVIKREKIGPVNLMAAEELKEIDNELGSILKEREDLTLAIEELRSAINALNAEARTRIMQTFEEVNGHFKMLFTRLYRGGEAYLQLIDSDDALEAGVEIFAQPPGKSLQSLSLMSGGEQTLAAIALIFAMFLTNPSPICVLDEVDAPLDDANVDRVCDVLEEISSHGHTRFLVITHHRLTMARMDRLYGVTMAEQGVSQLVSVDLQQELDFIDDAAA